MIGVTCRNGEHRSVDPKSIERVEATPDTVLHLVDGTKYVVADSFEHVLRVIRDHRAAAVVVHQRMYGGIAEVARHRATLRVERRARSRDGHPPAGGVLPGEDDAD